MSYQVLARKYRPASFNEMVGQEHVLKALVNALEQDKLHHAYLFSGTRGVGKTTVARIFARCLSCETGVTSTPCGECSSCREITEGRSVDLIEIDAASRTGVDDMRELLDNVQYMPSRSRFKVYLIDEVHMLTKQSFNAMLKTLEEPPEHVKFLLATTDPKKLPVTVLSRCLQFNLKNMSPERIVGHLGNVLGAEQIEYEEPALWLLGRAADGSMRDALSLTDQAISFGNQRVLVDDVRTMLGSVDRHEVYRLLDALRRADGGELLDRVRALAEYSPDYEALLAELMSILHRLAVAQAVPGAIDNSEGDQELLVELAASLSPEDVQLYYQVALAGRRDLPWTEDRAAGFEMTLLRMLAFQPGTSQPDNAVTDSPAPGGGSDQGSGGGPGQPDASPLSGLLDQLGGGQTTRPHARRDAVPPVPSRAEPAAGSDVVDDTVNRASPASAALNAVQGPLDAPREPIQSAAASESAAKRATGPSPVSAVFDQICDPADPVAVVTDSRPPAPMVADPTSPASLLLDEIDREPVTEPDDMAAPPPGTGDAMPAGAVAENPATTPVTQLLQDIHREPGESVLETPASAAADTAEEPAPTTSSPATGLLDRIDRADFEAAIGPEPALTTAPIPDPEPPVHDHALAATLLGAGDWVGLLPLLELRGITYALAANCAISEVSADQVALVVASDQASMLNDNHRQRIEHALSDSLGRPVRVGIDLGKPVVETPAEAALRLAAERQAEAVETIMNDKVVQSLISRFNGTLDRDSIAPNGAD